MIYFKSPLFSTSTLVGLEGVCWTCVCSPLTFLPARTEPSTPTTLTTLSRREKYLKTDFRFNLPSPREGMSHLVSNYRKIFSLGLIVCFNLQPEYKLGCFLFSSKSLLPTVTSLYEIMQSPNVPDRSPLK